MLWKAFPVPKYLLSTYDKFSLNCLNVLCFKDLEEKEVESDEDVVDEESQEYLKHLSDRVCHERANHFGSITACILKI